MDLGHEMRLGPGRQGQALRALRGLDGIGAADGAAAFNYHLYRLSR